MHELGARGGVEQRLGAGGDVELGILHERADALGELHAAGLAHQRHRCAAGGERVRESACERALAGAVEPLDRDQRAWRHGVTVSPRDARGTYDARVTLVDDDPAQMLPGIEAHPHARSVLAPALGPRGRPSHAYLFHGPAGSGKREVARAFAAALLAERPVEIEALVQRISRGSHPDVTWVAPSGAAEMLVGDIDQAVVAAATHTPFEAARRVFVLDGVHAMNDQAANRMLKTLEEPPSFVHLLLLTDRREDVLATVASRCQLVRFDAPPAEQLAQRLQCDDPLRASACARLALGDGRIARLLVSDEGVRLRGVVRAFVASALVDGGDERGSIAGLLDIVRAAGADAGAQADERLQRELELAGASERRRREREGQEAKRRGERRARTATLDLALRLCELWLRDVLCASEGAGELIHAVDVREEIERDARGRDRVALGAAIELVSDVRVALSLNVSEELALDALAQRLRALLAR